MWQTVFEVIFSVLGAVFWPLVLGIWLLLSWRKEKRRLRNGVLIALLIYSLVGLALRLLAATPVLGEALSPWVNLILLLAVPFSVLALAVLLIANGVTMMRRESRTPGNMLSLFAGLALIALPISAVLMMLSGIPFLFGVAGIAFFVSAYLGLVFASFLCFTIAYSRITPRTSAGAVVVHGSGLIRGDLTPLLRARVDLGLAEWQRQDAAGNTPFLIPSGGQGPDEPRSEAAAMAEYLEGHVPDAVLAPEGESRTTEENISFSRDMMIRRGADEPMILVTNNYHVPRAALLTQRLGVDADVIGAPTARYYLLSAYLREFIAVVSYHLKLHAILLAPFLLGTVFLTWMVARNMG